MHDSLLFYPSALTLLAVVPYVKQSISYQALSPEP